jgi:hypothetical protein
MESKRSQINALVSEATRDLLRDESKTRKCSQGELVEAALLAYCQPGATPETEGLVFARLLAIEETLAQIMGTLQALVTIAEAHLKKPAPPKIATYDEMYGPITLAEEEQGLRTAETALQGAGIDATLLHALDHATQEPARASARWTRWWRRKETP